MGFVAMGLAPARADQVSADGKVHVTYWEKWVGFEAAAMQAVVDRFNASQDRIVVEFLSISTVDRKTIVATAGGDPPDLAGLWTQNIAQFADAGALTPLDDFVRRDGSTPDAWLDRYYPVYGRLCTHAGRIYAGITTPAVLALHWNKTLFREAGLDPERPPATLAEFDAYARKLTKRDPKTGALTQMGFLPKEPGWWPWIFYRWFGGQLFDGDRITLATDPRNLAALHWVRSYTADYGGDDALRFHAGFGQPASSEAAFFTGKVAMTFQGIWYHNWIQQYRPGLDYGVGPWPEAVPGIKDFAMTEADVIVIPKAAKNPDAAWEFLKYINSHNPRATSAEELEGIERTCFLQGKNSPLRVWSPFFETRHPHPHIAVLRALSSSPNAVSVPDVGVWREYERELVNVFGEVTLLTATPEASIAAAQRRVEKSWLAYRRSLERHGQWQPTRTPENP